jgi:hypothetical protein
VEGIRAWSGVGAETSAMGPLGSLSGVVDIMVVEASWGVCDGGGVAADVRVDVDARFGKSAGGG